MGENYAELWWNIEPKNYKFGEKNQVKFMTFLAEYGFTADAWDYWLERLNSQDPIERRFIKYLIKYRTIIKKFIIMHELTASIQESADTLNITNK